MLVLVRHGETAENVAGVLLGRADPGLSENGRVQARALASELAGVQAVISSPLTRAHATAAVIAAAAGTDVTVDDRWIELDYGEFDTLPHTDVPRETWAAWQADPSWVPPGGESLIEVGRRVREACEALVPAARNADVAVVTHVSPIKAAVAWTLAVGEEVAWRLYVAPASITRIALVSDGRKSLLQSFNEVAHLA